MRCSVWLVGVVTLMQMFALAAVAAEPAKKNSKPAAAVEFTVGEPIRHANLAIFPIVSRTPRTADRFITLDEGLKAGTVEVLEASAANANADSAAAPRANAARAPVQQQEPALIAQGAGGGNDVNRLFVVNKSNKPLYLMPGEIIIGGDQDRTIGREYVIQPGKKPVPIEVFCVEHGRWGTRDHQALAGLVNNATAQQERRGSVALSGRNVQQLAKEANQGKFIGSVGKLSKGARIAVQEGKGQSEVWDEVGKENAKSKVKSGSGAFTGNYAEADAVKRLDPYLAKLQAPVADTSQIVGVIVAVNDKMDSAEMLESTPLFRKLWPKLLKSYALDAANANPKEKEKTACTRAQATTFLAELQQASAESAKKDGGLAVSQHISKRLSTSTAFDAEAAPAMMGGFGGGIHSSGFSK